jgi:hypothetical protein
MDMSEIATEDRLNDLLDAHERQLALDEVPTSSKARRSPIRSSSRLSWVAQALRGCHRQQPAKPMGY